MSRQEQLTQAFYEWEIRGRGWLLWEESVGLEPPFRPYYGPYGIPEPVVDDGRKHTALSRFAERIRTALTGPESVPETETAVPDWLYEHGPEDEEDRPTLVEYAARLPSDVSISVDALERWLIGLALTGPASFELLGTHGAIQAGFTCREPDQSFLKGSANAFVPEISLIDAPQRLAKSWVALREAETLVVDFGLSNEFMLPLATVGRFDPDPLGGVIAALESVQEDELGLLQVLFAPTSYPWASSIVRSVQDGRGGAFFENAPELLPLAKEKASRPLFSVVLRVVGSSPDEGRAVEIARRLGATLGQFTRPLGNELIPLSGDDLDPSEHQIDVFHRTSHRSGMILNSAELASLVHLPGPSVRSQRLERLDQRTKAAPTETATGTLVLGVNAHSGQERTVGLTQEQRLRHLHVVGASGTGKSTLLLKLILQDIEAGRGVGLLDPHGDLVDEILGRIPESRHRDVVLVDPSDTEHPVPFNVLAARSEGERTLLASDLGAIFRRFATSWGDQMTTVLGNAILAILEHSEGGNLVTLRRLLADADFRRDYLDGVHDPEVRFFWEREFKILRSGSQASILTRLNTFLRPKPIRAMVSQTENRIDFQNIMDDGKIFLAKIAHGLIGEENAHFLGSLLVAKFHQLAIGRQAQDVADRQPFFLFIDEFQNFVTPSMASILSGARKYGLGLALAHQDLRQLESSREVSGAVLANPGTRICFRLGDADARSLESGFSFFTRQDLQSLGIGEAIARIDRADQDFNLKTFPAPTLDRNETRVCREAVIAESRRQFATTPLSPPPDPNTLIPPATEAPPREPPTRGEKPTPATDSAAQAAKDPKRERRGQEHRYLQQLVARMGQDRGFKALLEETTPEGASRVDVVLVRGDERIAIEISVTSKARYEGEKARRIHEAGFSRLIVVVPDARAVAKLESVVQAELGEVPEGWLEVLAPEDLPAAFDAIAEPVANESVVRGYRVKVSHKADPAAAERQRRIAEVIARSVNRLKDD